MNDESLKKTRYVWLKNPENLTAKQQIKFHQLAAKNLKTHRAYEIKRAFQAIWDSPDMETAEAALKHWFLWATHSRLEPFQKTGWQLYNNKEHILSYFFLPINNSLVEGMNNKAKLILNSCNL